MTVNLTPNYQFRLPVPGTEIDVWGGLLNANWTDIDGDLKAVSDVAIAALPKAGGTMTGAIVLPAGTPTGTQAVNQAYLLTQIALLATLVSPVFTGNPTGPTPAFGDNDFSLATTAFVQSAIGTEVQNAQTGTTYTLALTDVAKLVTLNNAAAIALTIPTNATVAFVVGSRIDLAQFGAGQVTIGGAGVTILSNGNKLKLNGQYAGATLWKQATNTWLLVGNTAT